MVPDKNNIVIVSILNCQSISHIRISAILGFGRQVWVMSSILDRPYRISIDAVFDILCQDSKSNLPSGHFSMDPI